MDELKEKKVEYLELIYDLIFVYMIGRNNSILHNIEDGFIVPQAFIIYILCTLAIIQIWSFTTYYINMFGRNGIRDHVFLCINMYLIYYMGESIKPDWQAYQLQYHAAWGLIIVNIGVQYLLEHRNHNSYIANRELIKRMCIALFAEAVLIFAAGITGPEAGTALSAVAIFLGIVLTVVSRKKSTGELVDFAHLTERAMLYVVFTFGEMIIVLSGYFGSEGALDVNSIYFSLMAFLIVVGLFLSYEMIYDYLIDRESKNDGLMYLAIHIFIIFALNNITVSLEFMREEDINILPKMILIVFSVVGYFVFLSALKKYEIKNCMHSKAFHFKIMLFTVLFIILMLIFRENMYVNIFVTVVYVFLIFMVIKPVRQSRI